MPQQASPTSEGRASDADWEAPYYRVRAAGFQVRNQKPYAAEGHPAPISSPTSRAQLWDAEQTKAYYAGQPIPELPQVDDEGDLLDRHEAAELLGISPVTWNGYKNDPDLVDGMVLVPAGPKGTEHWPRRLVLAYKNKRPGRAAGGGRPAGSGDMIPRDQVLPRIAEIRDADPAITLETVADTLGIAKFPTAQSGLATLRGRRIADLVEAQPDLDPKAAAIQLGYPAVTHRGAITIAERELHARSAKPYLQHTADFLAAAGIAPSRLRWRCVRSTESTSPPLFRSRPTSRRRPSCGTSASDGGPRPAAGTPSASPSTPRPKARGSATWTADCAPNRKSCSQLSTTHARAPSALVTLPELGKARTGRTSSSRTDDCMVWDGRW
ncbi:hypothetical protein [Streptomyces litmocidini]|uniref:hypothetical protein n=1 Tax=Streptomyces litmocidini TaxID=67318 RepID=UPI003F53F175